MAPEKQAVRCCLLGEAADVAAPFLTRERELGDARLTELQDGLPSGPAQPFGGLTGIWSITAVRFCSLTALYRSQAFGTTLGVHSTLPAAALSSELLNILLLVGPGSV